MLSSNFIFIIPAAAIIAAAIVFKAILDYWGRYKYSYQESAITDKLKFKPSDTYSIIKWVAILIGLGIALLVIEIFFTDPSPELIFGIMFLFAGIGLILFFVYSERKTKIK
ncbi:hypothetical protein ACFLTH_00070 [Bacteroidota bacterium]